MLSDITYVPLSVRGFCYLSMIMDRFSRRLIGWHLDITMTEDLVVRSLKHAIGTRSVKANLIHHSDRGGQYASRKYRDVLRRSGMRQSMSAAGNCYDNAFMESCFGTVKTELELVEYRNSAEALRELSSYISYYNNERRHSSLGYVSPAQFEPQNLLEK